MSRLVIKLYIQAPVPDEVTDQQIEDAEVTLAQVGARLIDPAYADFQGKLKALLKEGGING